MNGINKIIINKGLNRFQGNDKDEVIIYAGFEEYDNGYLEEIFIHEGMHASIEAPYINSSEWRSAQNTDPIFISAYAKVNSLRENFAESFLPYFALCYRPDRISLTAKSKIQEAMPNRVAYFDSLVQDLDMSPLELNK